MPRVCVYFSSDYLNLKWGVVLGLTWKVQWVLSHPKGLLQLVQWPGFLGILGWVENWTVLLLFHGINIFCLLLSWNACIFHLREGKGITFLLHGVKIVDSVVQFFLYVYIPLTILTVRSTSTVSVSKQVLINLKIKSQTGLISLVISAILNWSFRCFLSQHCLKSMLTHWITALTLNEKVSVDFPSYA